MVRSKSRRNVLRSPAAVSRKLVSNISSLFREFWITSSNKGELSVLHCIFPIISKFLKFQCVSGTIHVYACIPHQTCILEFIDYWIIILNVKLYLRWYNMKFNFKYSYCYSLYSNKTYPVDNSLFPMSKRVGRALIQFRLAKNSIYIGKCSTLCRWHFKNCSLCSSTIWNLVGRANGAKFDFAFVFLRVTLTSIFFGVYVVLSDAVLAATLPPTIVASSINSIHM